MMRGLCGGVRRRGEQRRPGGCAAGPRAGRDGFCERSELDDQLERREWLAGGAAEPVRGLPEGAAAERGGGGL